jgi:excisionase family DNA binding protein
MDEYLTTREVAEVLKVDRKTALRYIKGGVVPAVKLGGRWLISKKRLEEVLEPKGQR